MSGYARGGGSSGANEGPSAAENGSAIWRTCTFTQWSNTSDAGVATATAQPAIDVHDPVDQGFPHVDVSPNVSQPSVETGVSAGTATAADGRAIVAACCMPSCIEPVITKALKARAPRIPQSVPLPKSVSCKRNALESAARNRREKGRGRMLEFGKPRVRN